MIKRCTKYFFGLGYAGYVLLSAANLKLEVLARLFVIFDKKESMKTSSLFIVLFFIVFGNVLAQETIFGQWKTIDDITGSVRSIVEIVEKDGMAYGKVIKGYPAPGESPDKVCTLCEGSRKNKPIVGMTIITAMKYDEDDKAWVNGEILDPDSGQVYECKIWLEEGKLKVRGYVSLFYRTQSWIRVSS